MFFHNLISGYSKKTIVAMVVVGLLLMASHGTILSYEAETHKVDLLKQRLGTYMEQRQPDLWWFTKPPTIPDGLEQAARLIQSRKELIERMVQKYRLTAPLALRIAESFPKFRVSIYAGDHSVSVFGQESKTTLDAKNLEIAFIPASNAANHPSSLYYKREWGTVMMMGVEYPEPVFAALFFHEAGHALYDQKDHNPSATAPIHSNLWLEEEVIMHELEQQILDAASGRKFSRQLDEIIARFPKAQQTKNFREIILAMTLEDFQALDHSIGCERCGPRLAAPLAAEYMLAVAFRVLNQHQTSLGEKIAAYRWIDVSILGPP